MKDPANTRFDNNSADCSASNLGMTRYYAHGPEELPAPNEILSMSGLQFMEGVRDGTIPSPPIGRTLNYWLDVVEEGRIVFRGKPKFESMNPMGTLHGGWYGTLLDSCMACAIMTRVPKGSIYTTLEYKVNITRALPIETAIVAEGTVQHSGRSTGVAVGVIRDAQDGKLYATGSTTCMIFKP